MKDFYRILIISGPRTGSTWFEQQCIYYNYDEWFKKQGEYFSKPDRNIDTYIADSRTYANYTLRIRPHHIQKWHSSKDPKVQDSVFTLFNRHNYRIALRRRDEWEQLCSYFIQEKLNWVNPNPTVEQPINQKFSISKSDVFNIQRMIKNDTQFLDHWRNYWTHYVYYEDLVADRDGVLNEIFKNKPTQFIKIKQDKRDIIQNYDEAREYWQTL